MVALPPYLSLVWRCSTCIGTSPSPPVLVCPPKPGCRAPKGSGGHPWASGMSSHQCGCASVAVQGKCIYPWCFPLRCLITNRTCSLPLRFWRIIIVKVDLFWFVKDLFLTPCLSEYCILQRVVHKLDNAGIRGSSGVFQFVGDWWTLSIWRFTCSIGLTTASIRSSTKAFISLPSLPSGIW